MASTILANSQVFAGCVEVTEPPVGLQGAGFVVGVVGTVIFLEGSPAGFGGRADR